MKKFSVTNKGKESNLVLKSSKGDQLILKFGKEEILEDSQMLLFAKSLRGFKPYLFIKEVKADYEPTENKSLSKEKPLEPINARVEEEKAPESQAINEVESATKEVEQEVKPAKKTKKKATRRGRPSKK